MCEAESSDKEETTSSDTFAGLGVNAELVKACDNLKWTKPTPIQKEAIPPAIEGTLNDES